MYRAKVPVCSEIRTKQINALFGHDVEFLLVELGGTQSNSCDSNKSTN
jgi:hypothetical protein